MNSKMSECCDCLDVLTSAHSISVVPPATMIEENLRRDSV